MADPVRNLIERGDRLWENAEYIGALDSYTSVIRAATATPGAVSRHQQMRAEYGRGQVLLRLGRYQDSAAAFARASGHIDRDGSVASMRGKAQAELSQAIALFAAGQHAKSAEVVIAMADSVGGLATGDPKGQVLAALVELSGGLAEVEAWGPLVSVLDRIVALFADSPFREQRAQAAVAALERWIVLDGSEGERERSQLCALTEERVDDLRWATEQALVVAGQADLLPKDARRLIAAAECVQAQVSEGQWQMTPSNPIAQRQKTIVWGRRRPKGSMRDRARPLLTYGKILAVGRPWLPPSR